MKGYVEQRRCASRVIYADGRDLKDPLLSPTNHCKRRFRSRLTRDSGARFSSAIVVLSGFERAGATPAVIGPGPPASEAPRAIRDILKREAGLA